MRYAVTGMRRTPGRDEILMSMLPIWQVKLVTIRIRGGAVVSSVTCYRITCPSCGEKAYVNKQWVEPHMHEVKEGERPLMIVGRPCSYCFKTAQVPEEFPGGRPRG